MFLADITSWPIGPAPILVTLASLYQYGLVLFGQRELTNNRMYSIVGLSAGITIFLAWICGYRSVSELHVETIALFCVVTAILANALGFLAVRNSDFGQRHLSKLSKLSKSTLLYRFAYTLILFGIALIIAWLGEAFIESPKPCTRTGCTASELLFGSKYSLFPFLWFYLLIGGGALTVALSLFYRLISAKITIED